MVVPIVAESGEQFAGCDEGIDAALCVDGRNAIGLRFRLGAAEAVVVG